MANEQGNFRSAIFGGFNRQDVSDYVEALALERNKCQEEADALRQANEALMAEKAEFTDKLSFALASAGEAQENLKATTAEMDAMRKRTAETLDEKQLLQEQLDTIFATSNAVQEQLNTSLSEKDAIQQRLNDALAEKNSILQKLDAVISENNNLKAQLEMERVQQQEFEIDTLNAALAAVTGFRNQFCGAAVKMSELANISNSKIAELANAANDNLDQLEKCAEFIPQMSADVENELSNLIRQINDRKNRI